MLFTGNRFRYKASSVQVNTSRSAQSIDYYETNKDRGFVKNIELALTVP